MDYRAIGLKVGLEIHQQLATHKLFCEDASVLVDAPGGLRFRRRLRPTQSELGEVDAAAIEEAKRRLTFVYETTPNSCLVEADEEPPHPPNPEALDIALEIALLLDAKCVAEVDFMRKIVIDGSNTSGFQRSALVALDGHLDTGGKRIGVPTILLEEDAARKLEETEGEVAYRLDRLGIPLVEIATSPDIETPEESREVALAIGSLLRATRKVLRGIGTIREDLNVSIRGGARVEIKGVQDLRLMATFVEREVERQRMLLEVAAELKKRGVKAVASESKNVSTAFRETQSKVVATAIAKGGGVFGRALPGFEGLLGGKLGPELAAHARIAGFAGIFHSDELPGYGITKAEVEAVRESLGAKAQHAFVLVAGDASNARDAMEEVASRANAALEGVPPETREPRPDGTTVYSRPLPGKARMYPETDVPPIRVTRERLDRIAEQLPEKPQEGIPRIVSEYGIDKQRAEQLFREGRVGTFEKIAKEFGDAGTAATTLTYVASELGKSGYDVDKIPEDNWRELFSLLKASRFSKEAIPEVTKVMIRDNARASDALNILKVTGLGKEELSKIVDEILDSSADLVDARGLEAERTLMGRLMERVRGRADGKVVSEVLHERLADRLREPKKREKKGKR
jgi:glutamyl-tRNA(Gln) amidotransferase subunit E